MAASTLPATSLAICDRSRASASLGVSDPAGVVDEDAPHHARRDAEEVRPVLPARLALANVAQVRLVDERSRLKGVAGPLATHEPMREQPKLALDQRREALEGRRVATRPRDQQVGHLVGWDGACAQRSLRPAILA